MESFKDTYICFFNDCITQSFDFFRAGYSTIHPNDAAVQTVPTYIESSVSPGLSSEVKYITYGGRIYINLEKANGDIPLHIDTRFYWMNYYKILVLNSNRDGQDGTEISFKDKFPPIHFERINTVQVKIGESAFTISINGEEITTFPYRQNLRPPIDKVVVGYEEYIAINPAKIYSIAFSE